MGAVGGRGSRGPESTELFWMNLGAVGGRWEGGQRKEETLKSEDGPPLGDEGKPGALGEVALGVRTSHMGDKGT